MENTLENKSKFFAQYWGQKILKGFPEEKSSIFRRVNSSNIDRAISVTYLELTPLSQISDEDAIEVAKIIDSAPFITKKKWQIERIDNEPASYLKISSDKSYHYYEIDYDGYLWYKHEDDDEIPTMALPDYLGAFDYLRSKGYALSWMNLTVEQLIEYKWIVLKK